MINQVALTGRLTRDADLRYTPKGNAVATFTLAVDRRFTNQQGERESDFINCVMWRKSAENFSNFTRKGSMVGIEGRIQTRNYENTQGQRVYVTEVLAEDFSLLESRATTEARPRGGNDSGNSSSNNQGNGSYKNQNEEQTQQPTTPADPFDNHDPFANTGEQVNISDDDLPF